jgi:hypothetical protein
MVRQQAYHGGEHMIEQHCSSHSGQGIKERGREREKERERERERGSSWGSNTLFKATPPMT